MYVIDPAIKRDPVRRWNLPDRVFFACGACQVLAHVALEAHAADGFRPKWLRPAAGFRGNHIVITDGERAFDYHGWTRLDALVDHIRRKALRWWPGWSAEVLDFPVEALVSATKSEAAGLRMLQPDEFLHDPRPRARAFLAARPMPVIERSRWRNPAAIA